MSINAMHVAKTGLNAQQTRMQIISNNFGKNGSTIWHYSALFGTILYFLLLFGTNLTTKAFHSSPNRGLHSMGFWRFKRAGEGLLSSPSVPDTQNHQNTFSF